MIGFKSQSKLTELSIDLVDKRYTRASFEGQKYLANFSEFLADWMKFVSNPWNAVFVCEPTIISLGYLRIRNGPKYRQWVPGQRLRCYTVKSNVAGLFTAQVLSYSPGTGDCEFLIDAIDAGASDFSSHPIVTAWAATAVGRPDMLAAGGNIAVASGGTGSSLVRSPHAAREALNLTSPLLTVAEVYEDFIEFVNPDAGATNFPWRVSKNGTGVLATDELPVSLATNVFFAGVAVLRTVNNLDYIQIDRLEPTRGGAALANNNFEFLCRINIESLADAVNDYQFQIGFGGYQATPGIDLYSYSGFGFEYNRSVSSNWRCKVVNAGSITSNTTATAVSTGWVVLGISKTGSTMTFTINGVSVYTPTTGYPTTNAQTNMTNLAAMFRRTAGSATNRNIYIDYMWNRHVATGR